MKKFITPVHPLSFLLVLYSFFLFFFILFINHYYLEGIPHVPDDVAYLFMAKMFASGHIIQQIPISPEHFDFFPGILTVQEGLWHFQYPFGHPLLLAIGILLGYPQIIPPLVGTFGIILLYFIARNVYGNFVALFLLPLPFISPFFLSNAASYMSHNTAFFYLVCSLFFLIKVVKKISLNNSILTGIFLGLLFNTRPLTALPFIFSFIFILYITGKKAKWKSIGAFSFGFLFFLITWFFYNSATTQHTLLSQYFFVNKHLFTSSPNLTFVQILQERATNIYILFNNFGPMLFNWPILIPYSLFFIPFVFRKQSFYDIFFFLSLFSLPIAYFFYNGTFIMYGSRFWYEILPFVFLLIARSIYLLYTYNKIVTSTFYVLLIFLSLARLFSLLPMKNPDYFSPTQLASLKGFNFTDNRLPSLMQKNHIKNAVVFVEDCAGNWWCYGSVFANNNPTLTTDIIYAKDLGDQKNSILYSYFANKRLYRVNYYSLKIEELYR